MSSSLQPPGPWPLLQSPLSPSGVEIELLIFPVHDFLVHFKRHLVNDDLADLLAICSVQYSTVQYSTVKYSTVQYSTVQYSTVQYSTVQTVQ